jgi:diketogulonate reductase-like aldo/keto reductase
VPKHFVQLMSEEGVQIKPAVNQIEFHSWNLQREIRKWCKENGVVVVAYSPLTQRQVMEDSMILKAAEKYGKTAAQAVLRCHVLEI